MATPTTKPIAIAATFLLVAIALMQAAENEQRFCNKGKAGLCKYLCCNRTEANKASYGCCPHSNATCCKDVEYCCPAKYKCMITNNGTGKNTTVKCVYDGHALLHRSRRSIMARPMKVDYTGIDAPKHGILPGKVIQKQTRPNSLCPDGAYRCPGNQTCCVQKNKQNACCPLDDGVCCKDGFHCCPHGYKCDSADQRTCSKPPSFILLKAMKTVSKVDKYEDIECEDGSSCQNNQTCCERKDKHYGCCPLVDAVCCSDGVHCCPEGYKCSSSPGECVKGIQTEAIVKLNEKEFVGTIRCADGTLCSSGDTCCKTATGYGCCPNENAVCCADLIHCCPHGTVCNLTAFTCHSVESVSATELVGNVECPDGSLCPNGNTCCDMGSGEFGCCPSSDSVCCADHGHCCKAGYTCNSTDHTCTKAEVAKPKSVFDVTCADGSKCKDNQTCCKGKTGYGCCPLPNAVCCPDMTHCCPNDYACQPSTGKCTDARNGLEIDIVRIDDENLPSMKLIPNKENDLGMIRCPDKGYCNDNQTCCKTFRAGQYGCCPLKSAVCCSDQIHCCPNGTKCNGSQCVKSDESKKVNVVVKAPENTCLDGHQCTSSQTCCQTNAGTFGCCPVAHAVCCRDHVHCCRPGYKCSNASDNCIKKDNVTSSLNLLLTAPTAIPCSDGNECPDSTTCCMSPDKKSGCCPIANAVCCSDGVHCCPAGESCDSMGSCHSLVESRKIELVEITCPDERMTCDWNSTCCSLGVEEVSYGCCPLPNAVCCSDHLHCCPDSFTCDSTGSCSKEGRKMSYVGVGVSSERNRERNDIV